MMSRGIGAPVSSRRYPVSITCEISVLISMIWPRLALGGTLMRVRAMSVVLQAGRDGDDHFDGVGPQRAVAQLRDGDDILRIRKTDAGRERRLAGARAEMHRDNVGLRILLVEDVDRLHVIRLRHRTFDRNRHRNGIAVF